MKRRLLVWPTLLALACSRGRPPLSGELAPGVVFPTSLGEGSGDGPEVELGGAAATSAGGAGGAGAAGAGGGTARLDGPPDPEPLRLADQWEYELEWKGAALGVRSVRRVHFQQPVVTARRIGRYAIELWIGHELIDRVRFEVPLVAAESEPTAGAGGRRARKLSEPPSLTTGLHAELRVLVPAAVRATRAVLVDRATGETRALPWPPDKPLGGFQASGGQTSGTGP